MNDIAAGAVLGVDATSVDLHDGWSRFEPTTTEECRYVISMFNISCLCIQAVQMLSVPAYAAVQVPCIVGYSSGLNHQSSR